MSAYVDQNHVPSFTCIRFEGYGYCYAHKNNEGNEENVEYFYQTGIKNTK